MPFEKSKVLKAAEKFLSQGKISAAIKEYRQIVDDDPDDLTTLNMLGDLLARAGEQEEAVECFYRIAEHYREQEFRLKAIAMYKKIEKLKPRDPATANQLAELYAAQGLFVDARSQYLVVADAFTRAGDAKKALLILHKIADLDPNNTDIRLKLAQGYEKEGMETEAAKAFSEAATHLLETGEFEKALQAFTKVMELRPNDSAALKGIVSAHTALGSAQDAAELLEKAMSVDPGDEELITMLTQAYIDADDGAGAERAVGTLMSRDATNYRRYLEVAQLYLRLNQQDDATRVLGIILEQMLAARGENDLLELVNEVLARDPEHIAGLRLLVRIHWWQRDMEKLRAALERLAESAQAAGLADDERYALTQLIRLAPGEEHFVNRLLELGGSLEEVSEEAHFGDSDSSQTAPSFETFQIIEETVTDAFEADEPVAEFEFNSVAEPALADPSASFADLNEPGEASSDAALVEVVFEGVEAHDEIQSTAPVSSVPDSRLTDSASGHGIMQQELESVDFYISQGYSDIAADTLGLLEQQFGSQPEIAARREKLTLLQEGQHASAGPVANVSGQGIEGLEVSPVIEVAIASAPPSAPQQEPPSAGMGIDSGLAEIFEEFRAEAEGEHAGSNEDYETHFNMATAYKEMDLLDDAIREFQTAAGLTVPIDGTPRYFQCCNMLGHCFVQKGMPQAAVLWFKKGLEAPGRTSEEYKALQYELGSAYEQMGDLTRAIAVFTEVYGVDVSYRDVSQRLSELQGRQSQKKKKKWK